MVSFDVSPVCSMLVCDFWVDTKRSEQEIAESFFFFKFHFRAPEGTAPYVARYILIDLSTTAALMCGSSSLRATPSAWGRRRAVPSVE